MALPIGTKVKITGNSNYSSNKVGDIGTVISEPNSRGEQRVQVGDSKSYATWTRQNEMKVFGVRYKRVLASYDRIVEAEVEVGGVKYIITSDSDDGEVKISTHEKLESFGWSLETDEVKELTMEEIAAKFNISTQQLRIKE